MPRHVQQEQSTPARQRARRSPPLLLLRPPACSPVPITPATHAPGRPQPPSVSTHPPLAAWLHALNAASSLCHQTSLVAPSCQARWMTRPMLRSPRPMKSSIAAQQR